MAFQLTAEGMSRLGRLLDEVLVLEASQRVGIVRRNVETARKTGHRMPVAMQVPIRYKLYRGYA